MKTFQGKLGNASSGEYGTVYNPFGYNYTGWTPPEIGGSSGSNSIYQPPQIYDEPPNVYDQNDMQPPVKKDTSIIVPIMTTNIIPSGNANNLLEQGKDLIKQNPLVSLGVAVALGLMLFGGKGK